MKKEPVISVITPVYKVEKYLSQCIDSIMAQSFTDFELLLIDDGSPDRCGEICDEYAGKDKRIRVFHQGNAGVSAARNKGLKEAQGRYVTFVDSDDYVLPGYLHDLYAERSVDGLKGVVIETVTKLFPNNETYLCALPEMNLHKEDYGHLLTELADKNIGYSASKLYDITVIRQYKLSFLSGISLLEDFFFLLDYVQHVDFVKIRNVSNYMYRVFHSVEAQSICYKATEQEYDIFKNYYSRIMNNHMQYSLSSSELRQVQHSLDIYFHRTLLSLYHGAAKTSHHVRVQSLRKILADSENYVREIFCPAYFVDKIGRYFLIHHLYRCFDLWMRFLLGMKFKKMFGSDKY